MKSMFNFKNLKLDEMSIFKLKDTKLSTRHHIRYEFSITFLHDYEWIVAEKQIGLKVEFAYISTNSQVTTS